MRFLSAFFPSRYLQTKKIEVSLCIDFLAHEPKRAPCVWVEHEHTPRLNKLKSVVYYFVVRNNLEAFFLSRIRYERRGRMEGKN